MRSILLALLLFFCTMAAHAQLQQVISVVTDEVYRNAKDSAVYRYKPANYHTTPLDSIALRPRFDTAEFYAFRMGNPDTTRRSLRIQFHNAAWQVDSMHSIGYSMGSFSYGNIAHYRYDADGNDTLRVDTRTTVWPPANVDTETVVHKSYAAGKMTEHWLRRANGYGYRDRYTYSGGNLAVMETDSWNDILKTWEPNSRKQYTYDAARNLLTDTTWLWQTATLSWDINIVSMYTWNAANRQTMYERYEFSGGSSQINVRVLYAYNAAGLLVSDSTDSRIGGIFKRQGVQQYKYTAANMLDTATSWAWEDGKGYVPDGRGWYQYTTSGLLSRHHADVAGTTGGTWVYQEERRYQYNYVTLPEDTTTGIAMQQQVVGINLYPNPANDFIILTLDNKQSSTIAIYNNTGALLRQWEEKSGNTTRTIPLHGFENGNYILTVRGAGGSKVSRQFVVGK